MKSKIYAYVGQNFATIDVLNANKGRVQVEFRGGDILSVDNYVPATTRLISNPVVQQLIEKHPLFGSTIYTYKEFEDNIESAPEELVEVPEVTDFLSACEYLKKNHAAKATQLRSPNGVRTLAASFNLSFPNWAE